MLTGTARRLASTTARRRAIGLAAAGVYLAGLVIAVLIAMARYA